MARNTRILFVDDDTNVVSSFKRATRKLACDIIATSNPHEVLDLLQQHEVDVIVSDEHMPGIKGIDLLKKVKEAHPHIIRFMLTGDENFDTTVRALNEGKVHRFLTKPIEVEDLLGQIDKYIQKRLENSANESGSHNYIRG